MKSQARGLVASPEGISCRNGPVDMVGLTWSCTHNLDLNLFSLNQKVVQEMQFEVQLQECKLVETQNILSKFRGQPTADHDHLILINLR